MRNTGSMSPRPGALACVLLAGVATHAAAGEIKNIKDLLTDSAAGNVSAASLLGLSADAVTAVENNRGLVAAVKGLAKENSALGIAVTPARTSFTPMNLSSYASSPFYRLLGNTTLSYAQGSAKVDATDLRRRAVALETSLVFDPDFDPIIGYMRDAKRCVWEAPITPPTQPVSQEAFDAANKKYAECVEAKITVIQKKWNISRGSLSFGSGWVRAPDKPSTRLGKTVAASVVYGFDHFGTGMLRDNAALTLTYRRTQDAPVLKSLLTSEVQRKTSQLTALRFSGGTDKYRFLLERSTAKDHEVTASDRVFKFAAGANLKLSEGLWLAIRSGKQRKISGTGDESVTLLDLSYSLSEKAMLP